MKTLLGANSECSKALGLGRENTYRHIMDFPRPPSQTINLTFVTTPLLTTVPEGQAMLRPVSGEDWVAPLLYLPLSKGCHAPLASIFLGLVSLKKLQAATGKHWIKILLDLVPTRIGNVLIAIIISGSKGHLVMRTDIGTNWEMHPPFLPQPARCDQRIVTLLPGHSPTLVVSTMESILRTAGRLRAMGLPGRNAAPRAPPAPRTTAIPPHRVRATMTLWTPSVGTTPQSGCATLPGCTCHICNSKYQPRTAHGSVSKVTYVMMPLRPNRAEVSLAQLLPWPASTVTHLLLLLFLAMRPTREEEQFEGEEFRLGPPRRRLPVIGESSVVGTSASATPRPGRWVTSTRCALPWLPSPSV